MPLQIREVHRSTKHAQNNRFILNIWISNSLSHLPLNLYMSNFTCVDLSKIFLMTLVSSRWMVWFYYWLFEDGGSSVGRYLWDLVAARCGVFFMFCPVCGLTVVFLGSYLALWWPRWGRESWLCCFMLVCKACPVHRKLFTLSIDSIVNTVFALSIRTPEFLTILDLKFEQVQFTTQCSV